MHKDTPRDAETCGPLRLVLALVAMILLPAGSLLAGAYQLFPFCCLPLLMLGATLLQPNRPEAPGPPGEGKGPDGSGGSPTPDRPSNLPGGGLLLPNAEPAARRYRSEPVSTLTPSRTRRPAHPPERRPVPLQD